VDFTCYSCEGRSLGLYNKTPQKPHLNTSLKKDGGVMNNNIINPLT